MIKSQVGSLKRSKAILEPSNLADKTLRITETNYEAFLLARRHIKSRRIFIEDIVKIHRYFPSWLADGLCLNMQPRHSTDL